MLVEPGRRLRPVWAELTPARAALTGAALMVSIVIAGGAVGPPAAAHPLNRWGGLLQLEPVWPDLDPWPGLLLGASLIGMVALWVGVLVRVRRHPWSVPTLWGVGIAWMAPVVAGPPILSNDVYSYVAQGAVAAAGSDPATMSPYSLGWTSPLLQAVDPRWRGTGSPYGPLATMIERGAVHIAGPHPVLAVVALRVLSVVAVGIAAVIAVQLTHPRTDAGSARSAGRARARATTMLLVWANPLLLLHVVAAVHLEGALLVFLLLSMRLLRLGTAGATAAAVVCAAAAAAIKLPVGGVAVVLILAGVWHGSGVGGWLGTARAGAGVGAGVGVGRVRRTAALAGIAVATWGTLCAVAGSGWNITAVLTSPAAGRTTVAPATILADLATPLRWLGLVDGPTLDLSGRAITAVAAVAVIAYLVATAGRRSPTTSVGLGLLALALGSPVLYPWYLVWSVPLLAIEARNRWIARLALLAALGSLMTVQGLTRVETYLLVVAVTAAVAAWLAITEWAPHHRERARASALNPRAEGPGSDMPWGQAYSSVSPRRE